MGRGRRHSADFRYDRLNYALNFDEGPDEFQSDELPLRSFSVRFSATPPTKSISPPVAVANEGFLKKFRLKGKEKEKCEMSGEKGRGERKSGVNRSREGHGREERAIAVFLVSLASPLLRPILTFSAIRSVIENDKFYFLDCLESFTTLGFRFFLLITQFQYRFFFPGSNSHRIVIGDGRWCWCWWNEIGDFEVEGRSRSRVGQFETEASTLDVEVSVSSPVTRQKVAAAKQFIENHYTNHLQGLQDRKERRWALQRRAKEAQISNEEQQEMMRNLERRET